MLFADILLADPAHLQPLLQSIVQERTAWPFWVVHNAADCIGVCYAALLQTHSNTQTKLSIVLEETVSPCRTTTSDGVDLQHSKQTIALSH